MILGKMDNQGPLPFKYSPIWDSNEDFKNLISDAWAQKITGSPHYVWETKLKKLRIKLKTWARENEIQNKNKGKQSCK